MKFKDYLRLGKISIKSRKKSTRNTAFGLAFALIILIPIIFFTLAFTIDLKQKVNEQESISTFDIQTTTTFDDNNNRIYLRHDDIDKIISDEGVREYIKYENLYFRYDDYNGNNYVKLDINGKPFSWTNQELQNQNGMSPRLQIKIVDSKASNFLASSYVNDLNKMGKNALVGPGFSGDKKGQIIIREKFLELKNIDPQNVIGKHLTLYASLTSENNYMFLDNDSDPNNKYEPMHTNKSFKLLEDFEIVGVLSEDYYKINYITMDSASFIVADSSLYQDGELMYMPSIKEINSPYSGHGPEDENKYYLCTYAENLDSLIQKANKEKLIPTILPTVNFVDYGTALEPQKNYEVVCKDFDAASIIDSKIIASISKDYENMNYNPFCDSKYMNYKTFSTMGMYMALALGIFGGIILFATLLNLYNTINYSVEKRKNYIGMMRAIGSKNASIIKSYIVEILLIFKKAFLWILIFSAIFSYLIKMGIDSVFNSNYMQDVAPVVISLNFNYYFITLGVIVLFAILVALTFSYISCRPVTKKTILDVLVEDK